MLQSLAFIAVGAWLAWCLLNILLMLVAPYLMGGAGVVTNGIKTVFPQHLRDQLTVAEQAAILAHEEGHKAHRHALKNTMRVCLFMPRTVAEAFRQEIQADDYAAARGHAKALAGALRKLSTANQDLFRAQRLDGL